MPRLLLILRHAKSSWDDPALADHDRPLAPRGVVAAAAMRAHFRARELAPDLTLCSTARRAQETLAALGLAAAPVLERGLYHAGEDALLERLRGVDDAQRCVLLVGHNPGLEALVRALTGAAKPRAARRLAKGLKTGALAELELPIERWQELKPGLGSLTRLTRPKDLKQKGPRRAP
jgi:phosphohistidine phosphatase